MALCVPKRCVRSLIDLLSLFIIGRRRPLVDHGRSGVSRCVPRWDRDGADAVLLSSLAVTDDIEKFDLLCLVDVCIHKMQFLLQGLAWIIYCRVCSACCILQMFYQIHSRPEISSKCLEAQPSFCYCLPVSVGGSDPGSLGTKSSARRRGSSQRSHQCENGPFMLCN